VWSSIVVGAAVAIGVKSFLFVPRMALGVIDRLFIGRGMFKIVGGWSFRKIDGYISVVSTGGRKFSFVCV